MAESETSKAVEAPTDDAPGEKKKNSSTGRKIPARGNRKRLLGGGEGDYLVMLVAPADSDMPKGSLIRIPDCPQFESSNDAARWVKQETGQFQSGQQIAIVKFLDLATVELETQPRVKLKFKQKITVRGGGTPDDDSDE